MRRMVRPPCTHGQQSDLPHTSCLVLVDAKLSPLPSKLTTDQCIFPLWATKILFTISSVAVWVVCYVGFDRDIVGKMQDGKVDGGIPNPTLWQLCITSRTLVPIASPPTTTMHHASSTNIYDTVPNRPSTSSILNRSPSTYYCITLHIV